MLCKCFLILTIGSVAPLGSDDRFIVDYLSDKYDIVNFVEWNANERTFGDSKRFQKLLIRNFDENLDISDVEKEYPSVNFFILSGDLNAIENILLDKTFISIKYLYLLPGTAGLYDFHKIHYREVVLEFLGSFPNLEKCLISGHNFTTAEGNFERIKNLSKLEITWNGIEYLPNNFFLESQAFKRIEFEGKLFAKFGLEFLCSQRSIGMFGPKLQQIVASA